MVSKEKPSAKVNSRLAKDVAEWVNYEPCNRVYMDRIAKLDFAGARAVAKTENMTKGEQRSDQAAAYFNMVLQKKFENAPEMEKEFPALKKSIPTMVNMALATTIAKPTSTRPMK